MPIKGKAKALPPISRDNLFAYMAAGVVFVALVVIFVIIWNKATKSSAAPTVAFAKFGPYQVETQNSEVLASIAVETAVKDADWAMENKRDLDVIFKTVLAKYDASSSNDPNGMELVQEALRDEANRDLHTNIVQAALLTNYVLRRRE